MPYLYAEDTTPANAAQISADRGEIVRVMCCDAIPRRYYADELHAILAHSNEFGGGDDELEVVGDYGGRPVRVHLSAP